MTFRPYYKVDKFKSRVSILEVKKNLNFRPFQTLETLASLLTDIKLSTIKKKWVSFAL